MPGSTSSKTAVFIRAPEPEVGGDVSPSMDAGDPVAAEAAASLDARGLRAALVQAFDESGPKQEEIRPLAPPATPPPSPARRTGILSIATGSRLVKVSIGLGLLVVFGWMPMKTLLVASSVEAVVNSRIVTLRSPIDGIVAAAPVDFKAWSADKGAPALKIVDDKADRGRLDDLRRQLGNLEDERPLLAQRLALARANLDELTKQTQQFAQGRIRQLTARVSALNA